MRGGGQRCGVRFEQEYRFNSQHVSCVLPDAARSLHLRRKAEAGAKHARKGCRRESAQFRKKHARCAKADAFHESGAKIPSARQALTIYFSFIFILVFFQKIRMFKIIGAV